MSRLPSGLGSQPAKPGARVPQGTKTVRRTATDTAVVAVAMTAANALGYVLALSAARRLGPGPYGALAALLALVLIGYVVALGLETVTTRRLARGASPRDLMKLALITALTTGAIIASLAWALSAFLHLGNAIPVLAVAATLVPLTWLGFVQGISQGLERFGLLALVLVVHAVGKVGGGLIALFYGGSVAAILWGTAAGTLLAAVVATALVRRSVPTWRRERQPAPMARSLRPSTPFTRYWLSICSRTLT